MSKTINRVCPLCNASNIFDESELVSGMSIKDKDGKILQLNPPVETDENTFIQCDGCKRPIPLSENVVWDGLTWVRQGDRLD